MKFSTAVRNPLTRALLSRHPLRPLTRPLSTPPPPPNAEALAFVEARGYSAKISAGVVHALSSSGLSGDALLATIKSMAGAYEIGEGGAALEQLARSVEEEQARVEGRQRVTIRVVPPSAWDSALDLDGGDEPTRERALARAFTCEAFEGASLTDLVKFDSSDGARQLAEHIECACSGVMACSTCHVVVDPIWYEAVGAADEDEEDMLDLAHDPRRTSRLGCQVKLTPALDGMVVWVPHGANNMMDDIPEWSTDR